MLLSRSSGKTAAKTENESKVRNATQANCLDLVNCVPDGMLLIYKSAKWHIIYNVLNIAVLCDRSLKERYDTISIFNSDLQL